MIPLQMANILPGNKKEMNGELECYEAPSWPHTRPSPVGSLTHLWHISGAVLDLLLPAEHVD